MIDLQAFKEHALGRAAKFGVYSASDVTCTGVLQIIDRAETAEAEVKRLRETLMKIQDQASRAALVQDRSVNIIKQTCRVISGEAVAALTQRSAADDLDAFEHTAAIDPRPIEGKR